MHSLHLHPSISETTATEVIMNACRANPLRKPYGDLETGLTVNFMPTPAIGGHEACVRNLACVVVALANVDDSDN